MCATGPDYETRQNAQTVRYVPLLIAVCSGGILAPLNSTMLAVGLPSIREDFALGHAEIVWLASAYLIAMAVTQPIGGRMGDQLGRSLVYRAGLIGFLVTSLLAAAAPSYALLMVFRTAQSVAGAVIIPNGLAMLRESLDSNRLGRSTGALAGASAFAAALGPLLGALVLEAGSWRLLFLASVPLVAVAFGTHTLLGYRSGSGRSAFRLDIAGALNFAAILAAGTFFIGSLRSGGERAALLSAAAVLVLLAIFVPLQARGKAGIAEWRLFKNRGFSGATFYILLNTLVMYTLLLTMPFYIEELQGRASLYTGIVLGVHAIFTAIGAPAGGRLADAFGRRLPILLSGVILVCSCGLLAASITRDTALDLLLMPLVAIGFGLGMGQGAASAAAIEAAPRSLAGSAAGTSSMARWLGGVLGIALLGTILNTSDAAPPLYLFRWIFVILTAASGLACVFALMVHKRPPVHEAAEQAVSAPPVT